MIKFNKKYYFVKPVDLSECDTEFEVYSAQGLFMGSTVRGINSLFFTTDEERTSFEEFLLDETMAIQARVKFMEEYQVSVEEVKSLGLEVATICEKMDKVWGVPKTEMFKVLQPYI